MIVRTAAVLLLTLSCTGLGGAVQKSDGVATLEERVRAFSETLTIEGGGPEDYASYLHPSFTRWSHGPNDEVVERGPFLASIREWWDYGMRVRTAESRIAGVEVHDDLAIVRVERAEWFVDGDGAEAGSFRGFVTQVWALHDGAWLLVGLDVSRAP